jgi:hypothetical protein
LLQDEPCIVTIALHSHEDQFRHLAVTITEEVVVTTATKQMSLAESLRINSVLFVSERYTCKSPFFIFESLLMTSSK